MDTNNIEIGKKVIKDTLAQMGFESEVSERQEEGRVVFNVRCSDAKLLIGKLGATLEALQYLIKILVYKQIPPEQKFSFGLDIDDYKDKRVIYLKDLARKAASQVRQTKRPVSLVPMPSHERRVVHNYLSLFADVGSESLGSEPERKIIIRPKAAARNAAKPETDKDDFKFIENS